MSHSAELPPPSPPARRHKTALALTAVLAVVLIAAGVGFAVMRASSPNEESAKAAIEELYARRFNAVEARDLDAFMGTVDPDRAFLRECERQRFEARVRSDEPPFAPPVARVERWGDYFRVWLDTDYGLRRTFARYDGGRWYLSEPYPRELGPSVTKDYGGVKLRYSEAEGDLASVVGADLAAIMATILPRAAEPPSPLFEMQIATLSDPGGDCFALGRAQTWGTTIIVLQDVRLTPGYDHLTRDTASTIEHEALHWLQFDHATRTNMRQLPHWWVIEGWPSAIANQPSPSDRHYAICTSPPSYDDLRLGLRRDAKIEDVDRAYIVAAMLIERLAGPSDDAAYWRFFDEFSGNTDPYLRTTGADGRSFYSAWLEDASRQYC